MVSPNSTCKATRSLIVRSPRSAPDSARNFGPRDERHRTRIRGTAMSDEKALLAAIWEHPHEDTPRLMYADWLQENGQPERAEFIRVQCELARLEKGDASARKKDLEKRERKLWRQHRQVWQAG